MGGSEGAIAQVHRWRESLTQRLGGLGSVFDALVIGSGPAGLSIAAALGEAGLKVQGLSPTDPAAPWPNTYGVWRDELEALGLTHLLGHCWTNCVTYQGDREIALQRAYGLFDKEKLQQHWLQQGDRSGVTWHRGSAAQLEHLPHHSQLTTHSGETLAARIVVDATGHKPAFLRRPPAAGVAYQAAYGIVGRFSSPPVAPQQFVLMDYRSDYLSAEERSQPPTFLYAMDLGDDVYFVEETSLAYCPAVSFDVLKDRLYRRLAHHGVQVTEIHHVEHCLFPMNLPLPDFQQPVVGFGGAASMVHPASGYLVGAMLRRAPGLAQAIARALDTPNASPQSTAQAAWKALWPSDRVRKHYLYLFGLENLMRFDEARLQRFFATFFQLPQAHWSGFLADTLTIPELLVAMLGLFGQAPNDIRWGLMQSVGHDGDLLWRSLLGR